MQNFTYIAEDEPTSEAVLIDPSWDLAEVESIIQRSGIRIKYIINTHHHFDHTLGNRAMAGYTGAPIIQHEASELDHDIAVADGDSVEFGGSKLAVLHTPGHSLDSICLLGDGKIFTGDTLFVGSCGRVDLPGGSVRDLHASLGILRGLDGSLVVYPGHDYGGTTTSTIRMEKATNMVMQQLPEDKFLKMMGQ